MTSLFKSLNICSSEAPLLYVLLDENEDGYLDYDEFINGALRLRGPARSLELAMFTKETTKAQRWTSAKLQDLERQLDQICENTEGNKRALISLQELFGGLQRQASVTERKFTDDSDIYR